MTKQENKYIPLSICGHCGKDTQKDPYGDRTEKVIVAGYANMLCENCRYAMDNEIMKIAIKYLQNNQ